MNITEKSPNVILVDINDNPIGEMEKQEAHITPHLHRAFSVFLYSGNKMLIQQRALEKYHSGGKWSNCCCSHPRPGEETTEAVPRRMLEELGFNCDVEEIFTFIYYAYIEEDGIYEYEYDHVFIGEYNGEYVLNPEEAMSAEWIDMDELAKEVVQNPRKYSVWFLHCINRVIAEIKARN